MVGENRRACLFRLAENLVKSCTLCEDVAQRLCGTCSVHSRVTGAEPRGCWASQRPSPLHTRVPAGKRRVTGNSSGWPNSGHGRCPDAVERRSACVHTARGHRGPWAPRAREVGRAPAWRALRGQVAKGGLCAGLSRVGEQPAGGAVLGGRLTVR